MTGIWLLGLLRHRGLRLLGTATGIAVAVGLLGSLGVFLTASSATMTTRAAAGVAIDWQVAVTPGADPARVLDTVRSTPGVLGATSVGYAPTSGLSTRAADPGAAPTEQGSGPGTVLGLPDDHRALFPGTIRPLAGADRGVLLAQQTAATLHARPGDTVVVGRGDLPPVPVVVEGVVALPQADSLFQRVGAPTSAQPPAPPDNVLLLPAPMWHALFDPVAARHPDQVSLQIHAARDRALPPDPAAAYSMLTAAAHNLELRAAGGAVVGNNLAATLDTARQDAAYAQVLFLFLGAPGVVLAALLTTAVVAAGADRRRREQALLRLRGAGTGRLLGLAATEAAVVAALGLLLGTVVALLVSQGPLGVAQLDGAVVGRLIVAAVVGLVVAFVAVLGPAWRDLRSTTVAQGRTAVEPARGRLGRVGWAVGAALVTAGLVVVGLSSRNGYQLVLAPEGVPQISVSYWAFAGPALLWLGGGLLAYLAVDLVLARGVGLLRRGLTPVSGALAPVAASIVSRRRRMLGGSIVLLGLAVAFAVSTATFNTTYRAQAEVDAQLTNGADVTVTEPPGSRVGPGAAAAIAAVPGVQAVEPLQHRFASVGADLQDLYGIDPTSITRATTLDDQYFPGSTARAVLDRLTAAPGSILVSAETVADFALVPGDLLNLRLPDGHPGAAPGAQVTVPFHYAGIVSEFPTAPKDSFLVAHRDYVSAATGSDAVGAFLVDTGGAHTAETTAAVAAQLGPTAAVTDIATVRTRVGSSLTSVDLAGLTGVELGFAIILALAAGALVFALGTAQRRRGLAIATALGARPGQLHRLVASEAVVLGTGGLVVGGVMGAGLAWTLVAVLSGVFDPPPAQPTAPWGYVAVVVGTALLALSAATTAGVHIARRDTLATLREL